MKFLASATAKRQEFSSEHLLHVYLCSYALCHFFGKEFQWHDCMNMHEHFCDSSHSISLWAIFPAPHSWPPGCFPRTNPSCLRQLGPADPQAQKVRGPAPPSGHAQIGLCVPARSAQATSGSGSVPGPYAPQGSAPVGGPGTWARNPGLHGAQAEPSDLASLRRLGQARWPPVRVEP